MSSCDSTCIGLAVSLTIVIFLLGVMFMYFLKRSEDSPWWNQTQLKREEVERESDKKEEDVVPQVAVSAVMKEEAQKVRAEEKEASKKRAEELEKRLEKMSKENMDLKSVSKKLQEDIHVLSRMNNDMALDVV